MRAPNWKPLNASTELEAISKSKSKYSVYQRRFHSIDKYQTGVGRSEYTITNKISAWSYFIIDEEVQWD